MEGWIKLHRKLLAWEWYSKPVVKSVFIHSLLRANHKDGKWQGKPVKRGQFISSIDAMMRELGHSRQEIRTALKHLKSTNELTSVSSSQHTVFTVINYDLYQEPTNDQPTANQQLTNDQPTANQRSTTNKNDKKEKNEQEGKELIDSGKPQSKRFTPPTHQEVYEYMGEYSKEKGRPLGTDEADKFMSFYESKNWHVGKNKMKDWRASARNWVLNSKPPAQRQGSLRQDVNSIDHTLPEGFKF